MYIYIHISVNMYVCICMVYTYENIFTLFTHLKYTKLNILFHMLVYCIYMSLGLSKLIFTYTYIFFTTEA